MFIIKNNLFSLWLNGTVYLIIGSNDIKKPNFCIKQLIHINESQLNVIVESIARFQILFCFYLRNSAIFNMWISCGNTKVAEDVVERYTPLDIESIYLFTLICHLDVVFHFCCILNALLSTTQVVMFTISPIVCFVFSSFLVVSLRFRCCHCQVV